MLINPSLESPAFSLSSVKFSLQTDAFPLSCGLYTAYTWNWHMATLPVIDSNLELGSAVRPENFIVDCISMGKPMLKFSALQSLQRWRFISFYTSGPAALGNH